MIIEKRRHETVDLNWVSSFTDENLLLKRDSACGWLRLKVKQSVQSYCARRDCIVPGQGLRLYAVD